MTDCDIIHDLLPLYHDSACSPASRALVEGHVAACGACRAQLAALEAPVALAPVPAFQPPIQRLRAAKNQLVRRAALAVTAIFCALGICIAAGASLYTAFERERALPWGQSLLAGAERLDGIVRVDFTPPRYLRASCLFRRVTIDGQERDIAILQLTQSWTRKILDTSMGGPAQVTLGQGTGLVLGRGGQKHDVAYGPEYQPAYWDPRWEYPGTLSAVYYLDSPAPLDLRDAPAQAVLEALERHGQRIWGD